MFSPATGVPREGDSTSDTTSDSASNGGDPPIIDGWAAAHLASSSGGGGASGGGEDASSNYSRALNYIYDEMVKNSRSEVASNIRAQLALYDRCTSEPSLLESVSCAAIGPGNLLTSAIATWTSWVCEEICPWDHKPKIEKMLNLKETGDYFF